MWIALIGFGVMVLAVVSLMLMIQWIIREAGIPGVK